MSKFSRNQNRRQTVDIVSNYSGGVSSRKVRKEKKKVLSQSLKMIIVAVALFLAFIFIIIPNFFNFITNFLDSSTPFQEVDDIAPQIPIISAPVAATNSAELSISGYGEPESFVVFVQNGEKKEKVAIAEDGSFSVPLTLSEGENKIAAFSVDEAKNESSVTKEYITLFDSQAPSIEISEPADGSSFESRENQSITITGKTDEDEQGVKIYIAGKLVFPEDDGSFSHTYQLKEGENKLEITAQDKAGNSNKLEVTYSFRF